MHADVSKPLKMSSTTYNSIMHHVATQEGRKNRDFIYENKKILLEFATISSVMDEFDCCIINAKFTPTKYKRGIRLIPSCTSCPLDTCIFMDDDGESYDSTMLKIFEHVVKAKAKSFNEK